MSAIRKIFALMIMALVILAPNLCDAAKKKVAVMPLENVAGSDEKRAAEIMTEQLIVAIQNSGTYTVVERAQLGAVMNEIAFQTVATDPSEAIEFGKMTGADYSVVGKVTLGSADGGDEAAGLLGVFGKIVLQGENGEPSADIFDNLGKVFNKTYNSKVALNFRLVDNSTGEVLFAKTVEGSGTGSSEDVSIHEACKVAAANFVQDLQASNPFSARIEDIYGDELYIDQGYDSGLKVGEILKVTRESSPIIVHDKVVGMRQTEVGRAQVTEVNAEYSVCKIISVIEIIRKGDIVKR